MHHKLLIGFCPSFPQLVSLYRCDVSMHLYVYGSPRLVSGIILNSFNLIEAGSQMKLKFCQYARQPALWSLSPPSESFTCGSFSMESYLPSVALS